MDLCAACGFQGLLLGQGGLIIGREARVADQGHQNMPFAVPYNANKRPFVNGCKGAPCGAVHRKALGFLRLTTVREVSKTTARACNIQVCRGPPTKPFGKVQTARILHI